MLGNLLSFLFVDLPVGEPLAEARLRKIAAATRRRKSSGAAQATSTMIELAALAPPVVANAALARTVFSRRMFNVAVTNVPGSPAPLYAFGALLREIHPVLPLLADHAVGVAALSYNGLVTFGINADAVLDARHRRARARNRGRPRGATRAAARRDRDRRWEPLTEREDDSADRRRQRGHA